MTKFEYVVRLRMGKEMHYVMTVYPLRWTADSDNAYVFDSPKDARDKLLFQFNLSEDLLNHLSGFIRSCITDIEIIRRDYHSEKFVDYLRRRDN